MSRLLVVTRPELVAGFLLAGVEAIPAADVESAAEFIENLLNSGEACLLAIDDDLLAKIDEKLIRRMESAEQVPFLAIPAGEGSAEVVYRHRRLAELTRRAVGFHSIFKTEKTEMEET